MGTANKNLNEPANGSYANTWDVPVNNNSSILDATLGGVQVMNLTGNLTTPIVLTNTFPIVTTPLTSMSYLPQQIALTGTIGINTVIQFPAGVGGMWVVSNNTSGNFTVTFGVVGGTSSVSVGAGQQLLLVSDGTKVFSPGNPATSVFQIGDYKSSASSASQSGWLLCYGQAVSRTTYAALFAEIGVTYGAGDGSTTFNVPDKRGRASAGADNMGGVAAGRLTGYALGSTGGEQTHLLIGTEIPSHNHSASDAGHTHADAGHNHTVYAISGNSGTGAPGNFGFALQTISTSTGYANIQTGHASISIGYYGGGLAHNNVQPTIAEYVFIYAGV